VDSDCFLGLIFLQKIKPKKQSLSEGIFKLREQVPAAQGLKSHFLKFKPAPKRFNFARAKQYFVQKNVL
jgi:hypothetical protein